MALGHTPNLQLQSDAQVQGTNDDAQLSKASCVKLGYFKDDFIKYFVKRPVRRAPLINRGYYSRYAALRGLLLSFLELPATRHYGNTQTGGFHSTQESNGSTWPAAVPGSAANGHTAAASGLGGGAEQQEPLQLSLEQPSNTSEPQSGQQMHRSPQQAVAGPEAAPVLHAEPARHAEPAGHAGAAKQVLSLGAGFDTSFFQLVREGRAPARYFEVDFKEVTSRKAAVIQQTPELLSCLGAGPEVVTDVEAGRVLAPAYRLLQADLRDIDALAEALKAAGFDPGLPTFVLSECVLVYIEAEQSAAVVRWLGATLRCAVMAIYEQIRPEDPFGQQMLHNLDLRGCPLRGIWATPDLEAHRMRFLGSGWDRAEARSMDDIYRRCLEPGDRRRIERLELFDEFEEWDLIQAHYCIALGIKDRSGLLQDFGFREYGATLPAPNNNGNNNNQGTINQDANANNNNGGNNNANNKGTINFPPSIPPGPNNGNDNNQGTINQQANANGNNGGNNSANNQGTINFPPNNPPNPNGNNNNQGTINQQANANGNNGGNNNANNDATINFGKK